MTEAERLPWAEQLALDDASFRAQLAYLLDRSPFYREKLAGSDPGTAARRDRAAAAHREARGESDVHPGAARSALTSAADPSELVRIYSTSGTTGTPSYIPLTASDLDNWVTGSARSYAASGLAPATRVLTTYNAGPFVAGAALDAFGRIGLCHIPVGTGNSERADARDRGPAARRRRADAVLRRLPRSNGLGAASSSGARASAHPRRRRARRRRAGVSRRARGGLGRTRDRGDGDRRHRAVAVGRVRGAGGHAPRRTRLRPRRADRSGDGHGA